MRGFFARLFKRESDPLVSALLEEMGGNVALQLKLEALRAENQRLKAELAEWTRRWGSLEHADKMHARFDEQRARIEQLEGIARKFSDPDAHGGYLAVHEELAKALAGGQEKSRDWTYDLKTNL